MCITRSSRGEGILPVGSLPGERLARAVGEEEPGRAAGPVEHASHRVGRGLDRDVPALPPDPDEVAAIAGPLEGSPQHLQRPGVGDRLAAVEEPPLGVDGEAALGAEQLEGFVGHRPIMAAPAAPRQRRGAYPRWAQRVASLSRLSASYAAVFRTRSRSPK